MEAKFPRGANMANTVNHKTADLRKRVLAVTLTAFTSFASSFPASAEGLGWKLPGLAAAEFDGAEVLETGAVGWTLPGPAKALKDAAGRRVQSPADRASGTLLKGPSLILTGFSGHRYARPVLPEMQRQAARDNPDFQEIDLDAPVVTLSDIEGFGHAMNGDEVTRPPYDQLYAREIGQVFGAVLDDAVKPNLYLSATSAYGLQIVGPDKDANKVPDRLTKGDASAVWMEGQWGHETLSGPGTIWRVDGTTGQVAIFANITQDGLENPGASLGNLAFDPLRDSIFVSDLSTGLIARMNLRGTVLETFDHGQLARLTEGLPSLSYDPTRRVEITDTALDTLDPSTWGMAPDGRRVWGMAVQGDRLFYGVASGKAHRPEVLSVGLDARSGAFLNDPRWELTLAEGAALLDISDIGFAPDGALVLAQRGRRAPSYDFASLVEVGQAQVLRYVRESPKDDPTTPSVWVEVPDVVAVGFAPDAANGSGGLAFGPGYDAEGFLDFTQCRGTLWTTGEALRQNSELAIALQPGGMLQIDGAQAQPAILTHAQNTPPWLSYQIDFDGDFPLGKQQGYMGDVAVLGCNGAQAAATNANMEGSGQTCKGRSCQWLACLRDPKACLPDAKACAANAVTIDCDTKTGTWVASLTTKGIGKTRFNALKLTDPTGKLTSLPQTASLPAPPPNNPKVALTGLGAGQVGQIKLCSFDKDAAMDGLPHDCCNSSVEFKIPAKACVKEIQ